MVEVKSEFKQKWGRRVQTNHIFLLKVLAKKKDPIVCQLILLAFHHVHVKEEHLIVHGQFQLKFATTRADRCGGKVWRKKRVSESFTFEKVLYDPCYLVRVLRCLS